MPQAIEISSLNKIYNPRKGVQIHAVKDLHLNVPVGTIFGFLGPNGAGKTTTIKMTCGLVQPTSGTIRVNGNDVWNKRFSAMTQIGTVLEGTRNIHWPLSAWENLHYFGNLKGMHGKKLSQCAEGRLKEMDLWDRRKDPVKVFSRGMQQKVAVACALIADPPIVLLDEPTLGLDVQAARTIKEMVVRIAREQGKTVILTTHQLDLAQEVCDRVAIISKGQIITNRPVAELLSLFREDYYQIKVEGAISTEVREQFKGLTVDGKEGVTTISGAIKDQMMLVALLGEIRKGLLIGWAYKANQLISFLTLGFIFVVIVFFMTGGTLDPVRIAPAIIGYLTWMYVVAALSDLAFGLRAEMSAGTLEQLAMSPAPVGLLLTARVIVNIIVTTIEVILMAILVLVIFDIHINWSIDVLPILLLTLVGVLGFGFMIAGVVLIFKQIESFINLFNNLLAFLNGTFLPVSAMPGWLAAIAMAIPSTSGIIVIRKLMLDGKSLTDTWRDGSLVGLAINSVCYLLIGWIIFVVCERVAKRRGSLGQY